MKKNLIFVLLFSTAALFSGWALNYEVTFSDGYPLVRHDSGGEDDVYIGAVVRTGDTVITGEGELVELKSPSGAVITISESTVFSVYEMESGGQKQDVMGCFLGKMRLTVDKATKEEPMLMTNAVVCGVRGTDVTLLAGSDGSSLIIVEDGLVSVSAAGSEVQLAKGEGVEVPVGEAPGEKFEVLKGFEQYDNWLKDREKIVFQNPGQAVDNILDRLNGYIEEINKYSILVNENKRKLDEIERQYAQIKQKNDKDEIEKYFFETVVPYRTYTSNLFVNLRYYVKSAQSLRLYVIARIYLMLKAQYIADLNNTSYVDFLNKYSIWLSTYEASVSVHLVKADL